MLRRLLCAYWMTKYVGKFRFEILDDCMENAKDLKGLLFLPHPVYRIVRENSMVRSVCYRTKRDNFSKRPKATLLAFWLRTESGTGRQFHAEYTHTLHVRKGTWLDFFVFLSTYSILSECGLHGPRDVAWHHETLLIHEQHAHNPIITTAARLSYSVLQAS